LLRFSSGQPSNYDYVMVPITTTSYSVFNGHEATMVGDSQLHVRRNYPYGHLTQGK
jgi:hypothetical protein